MASSKRFAVKAGTGVNVYAIVRRLSDSYLLNDADGTFTVAPADPYVSLTEDSTLRGLYVLSESRTVWDDGEYLVGFYQRLGGSPAPSTDTNLSDSLVQSVRNDQIVTLGTLSDRVLQTLTPIILRIKKSIDEIEKDETLTKGFKAIEANFQDIKRVLNQK